MAGFKFTFYIKIILIVLSFSACDNDEDINSKKNFKKLYWLEGDWQGKFNNGMYYERWKKETPDKLTGISFYIENGDTLISEKESITRGRIKVFYSVQVGSSKNVDFLLIELTDVYAAFVNEWHDFPQRITYIKKDDNNLIARIEGINDKRKVSEEFRLQRKKWN